MLHIAVSDPEVQSKLERTRLLLDAGAEIDIRDVSFQTPLMSAASEGHFDVTRLLVSRGANIRAIANDENAYGIASGNGKVDCANFLFAVLEAGDWPAYVAYLRQPRIDLLMLRLLCQDGRAAAPAGTVLERLFAPPPPEPARRFSRSAARRRSVARTTLPKEVFWHVASFWRCDRDLVRHFKAPCQSLCIDFDNPLHFQNRKARPRAPLTWDWRFAVAPDVKAEAPAQGGAEMGVS